MEQVPFARKEVQVIRRIFSTKSLTGREATKDEVLRQLPSVALVHIAAHGRLETGEIALVPNTTRASQIPANEDFLLTMKDVMSVKIRTRLVVLSCCHSGHGEIKAEGLVGIAGTFLEFIFHFKIPLGRVISLVKDFSCKNRCLVEYNNNFQ